MSYTESSPSSSGRLKTSSFVRYNLVFSTGRREKLTRCMEKDFFFEGTETVDKNFFSIPFELIVYIYKN